MQFGKPHLRLVRIYLRRTRVVRFPSTYLVATIIRLMKEWVCLYQGFEVDSYECAPNTNSQLT